MAGSSMGKVLADTVPRWLAGLWWLVAAGAVAAAAAYAGVGWLPGVLAVAAAGLTCVGIVAKLRRVCGGVNGDVMGACIEFSLTAMAVILACG